MSFARQRLTLPTVEHIAQRAIGDAYDVAEEHSTVFRIYLRNAPWSVGLDTLVRMAEQMRRFRVKLRIGRNAGENASRDPADGELFIEVEK